MLLKKVVSAAAVALTASALTLSVTAGVAYAGDDAPATTKQSASPSPTASSSDTSTATIGFKQQNVVITALTLPSDTGTATITVKDPKQGSTLTWDVSRDVKVSGYYKKLSDLKPGFTIHLSGTRTGSAAPVADHVVAPGRNKKVELKNVTVTAVSGSAGTITVRDKKGGTTTWTVRSAKVEGKTKRAGDLSAGDVVSIRGTRTEGSPKGAASVVRVEKDVKPATKSKKSKSKSKKE